MSVADSATPTPVVCLKNLIPSPEAVACLPELFARRLMCVPMALDVVGAERKKELLLASVQPSDVVLRERVIRQLPAEWSVRFVLADESDINPALEKCYSQSLQGRALLNSCLVNAPDADEQYIKTKSAAGIVEAVLLHAYRERASDVHLSRCTDGVRIRFRIDGVLNGRLMLRQEFYSELVGRMKILAHMDIAEARHPQDGQFSQLIDNELVDFRVSLFPTINGENIVIRVLRANATQSGIESLALPAPIQQKLLECLHKPNGLIVFCGPTGSGKSTSLHALLSELDRESLNIMTLEDPVETVSPGIQQTSIDASRSLGYAECLRALMRQDPDVLLLGEVRDSSSCQMTLRAVMTGHSVLTTVHANNAVGAIDRLIELGANRKAVASHLLCIAAQRLIRKRCFACEGVWSDCNVCGGSGFHGRQAVVELLVVTSTLSALISAEAAQQTIIDEAMRSGFVPLSVQADLLVRQGISTSQEVSRVLGL